MKAVGTSESHADAVAICLTQADYKGHLCEGLYQLKTYVDEVEYGGCDKDAVPTILKESPVCAWVDGNNGLGVIVANFSMNLAIQKAKKCGIGWVVAKRSNNYGIAGMYSLKALDAGFLGLSFSNATPLVAPSRALEGALGANPISVAAPATNEDYFLLDMSTATVAHGKVEILGRKKLPVPTEWANPVTGALTPLGGSDPSSNYKGFGLAMFVEILCGILGDSGYGPYVRRYGDVHQAANIGHCFIAVNPNYFAPGFEERLSDLMNYIRNMQPADPERPVIVPGDFERQHMSTVDHQGGICYAKDLVKICQMLADRLNVTHLSPLI
ncbi:hypothetical protein Zmor_021674 [Zophobas morio]|uniref:Malate dehydrogenase n=2 Tax=Zophobas morio TaxID=2755281 RepID=A0AA38I8N6_9CUCU|nr:hypothetical protein Zmor_021674 [Zophobas morio]